MRLYSSLIVTASTVSACLSDSSFNAQSSSTTTFNHSANDEIVRAIAARKLLKANDVTNDEDRMYNVVPDVFLKAANKHDVILKRILPSYLEKDSADDAVASAFLRRDTQEKLRIAISPKDQYRALRKAFNEKTAAYVVIKTSVSRDDYMANIVAKELSKAQLNFWIKEKKTPGYVYNILRLRRGEVAELTGEPHKEFVAKLLLLDRYIQQWTRTEGPSSSKTTDDILFETLFDPSNVDRHIIFEMFQVRVDKQDFINLQERFVDYWLKTNGNDEKALAGFLETWGLKEKDLSYILNSRVVRTLKDLYLKSGGSPEGAGNTVASDLMTEMIALRKSFKDNVALGVHLEKWLQNSQSESEKAKKAFAYELAFFHLMGKYDDMNLKKFHKEVNGHEALEEDLQPVVEQLVTRYTHYANYGPHGFSPMGEFVYNVPVRRRNL
ncbi:hypothetical protein PsorP6_003106 [Peronosclerospora sorghi]|uniref:Uncharacterized protein n=1 Tax=Peronosclerospora sorghi TaxID=230839 RepID=A0ACC0VMP6_9STRA|nr:hypothetical protein PsorP6_003106 [Peronosclerospora sorghi]